MKGKMENKGKRPSMEEIKSLRREIESLKQEKAKHEEHIITEQRKAIKKLVETEALEASILNAIPHAVIGLHERRIIFTNNAVESVFGWKPEELIGKKTRILYRTEEEYKEIARHFYPTLKRQHSFSEEFPCKRKDGKDIVCLVSASRIGKTLKEKRIVIVYEDITEQKQKVKLMEESEERLKVIMDSLQIGIMLVDAEKHEIVDVNPAAIKMFGAPKEKIIGSVCHNFVCPAEIGKCPITDLGQTVDNSERVLLNVKSETVPILKTVLPITLNDRKVLLESFVDITDRKLTEEELRQSFINLAETISRAMSSKDPYTAGHQRKVAELAYLVGEKMGIEKNELQWLYIGGLLHDIGKVSIPEGILSKPGNLIKEELDLVYGHTRQGYEILKDSNLPWIVPELALHHHERMDGSGYPEGITGDDMTQEVRILAVCDVVDAMNSHRPYRPSRTKKEILEELKDGRGIKYDAKVVDIVIKLIKSGEYEIEDRNIYIRD